MSKAYFLCVILLIHHSNFDAVVASRSVQGKLSELRRAESEVLQRMLQDEAVSSLPPSSVLPLEPTPAPTSVHQSGQGCGIDLTISCELENGDSCEISEPTLVSCDAQPLVIGMRYDGGSCDQSNNDKGNKFYCEDFQGGPPLDSVSRSYIVATDANGQGTVYFEGWVDVGDYFNITAGYPSSDAALDPEIYLNIYRSEDKSEVNLIQFVKFDSSCSSPLNLGDDFGASQVVFWYSPEQGLVTAFQSIAYTIVVGVPSSQGSSITLSSLSVETNFAGTIDLSKTVDEQVLTSGDFITVPIPTNIDITVRKWYTFLTNLSGSTDKSDSCTASDFEAYDIGTPPPPGSPTASPVESPTSA